MLLFYARRYIPSAIIISFARILKMLTGVHLYKSKRSRTNEQTQGIFLWKPNWFQENDRSGPLSFPFSSCGLNEEKHFQYCTVTTLKYDKLLHYIQLYIIHNRSHYTPVGAMGENICNNKKVLGSRWFPPIVHRRAYAHIYVWMWLSMAVHLYVLALCWLLTFPGCTPPKWDWPLLPRIS